MQQLINWTNTHIAKKTLHPILNHGYFCLRILINSSPYQDGNGRLSRLLTTLLLLKQNYDFVEYVSFEHIIEARKERYYRVLMQTQKNRYTDDEILAQWTIFIFGLPN